MGIVMRLRDPKPEESRNDRLTVRRWLIFMRRTFCRRNPRHSKVVARSDDEPKAQSSLKSRRERTMRAILIYLAFGFLRFVRSLPLSKRNTPRKGRGRERGMI